MFLAGHPNHQLVFMRIWQIEPKYLLNSVREFYEDNPLNITRILDVAQDLKVRTWQMHYEEVKCRLLDRSWIISWTASHLLSPLMLPRWRLDANT